MKEFLIQNWAQILILIAFAIMLKTTVFLERRWIRRMYILIVAIFALSIIVFVEFRLEDTGGDRMWRIVLMSIRYSATPFIIAHVIYTLVKKLRWFVFIPALALAAVDIVSIFTGIVFSVDESYEFHRGPLGYLPFIVAGLYSVVLIVTLIRRSNKQKSEIIPIVFLACALGSGLIFPFIFGKEYAQIFCTTISVALFVYYVFSILQLTKKDSLTGLMNRQAYYADTAYEPKEISAIVSIDMNGLKKTNDTQGHAAGDEALVTLALCFHRALKRKQVAYRVGGDEFIIVCRQTSHNEVVQLVERIKKNVSETKYSCSIGYSYDANSEKDVETLLKESDEKMYAEKAAYYLESKNKTEA